MRTQIRPDDWTGPSTKPRPCGWFAASIRRIGCVEKLKMRELRQNRLSGMTATWVHNLLSPTHCPPHRHLDFVVDCLHIKTWLEVG